MKKFKTLVERLPKERQEEIHKRALELMTEYEEFLSRQSDEFKSEILLDVDKTTEQFVDQKYKPISIEELKELDKKYNGVSDT